MRGTERISFPFHPQVTPRGWLGGTLSGRTDRGLVDTRGNWAVQETSSDAVALDALRSSEEATLGPVQRSRLSGPRWAHGPHVAAPFWPWACGTLPAALCPWAGPAALGTFPPGQMEGGLCQDARPGSEGALSPSGPQFPCPRSEVLPTAAPARRPGLCCNHPAGTPVGPRTCGWPVLTRPSRLLGALPRPSKPSSRWQRRTESNAAELSTSRGTVKGARRRAPGRTDTHTRNGRSRLEAAPSRSDGMARTQTPGR